MYNIFFLPNYFKKFSFALIVYDLKATFFVSLKYVNWFDYFHVMIHCIRTCVRKPPRDINFCVLKTAESRAMIWPVKLI